MWRWLPELPDKDWKEQICLQNWIVPTTWLDNIYKIMIVTSSLYQYTRLELYKAPPKDDYLASTFKIYNGKPQ